MNWRWLFSHLPYSLTTHLSLFLLFPSLTWQTSGVLLNPSQESLRSLSSKYHNNSWRQSQRQMARPLILLRNYSNTTLKQNDPFYQFCLVITEYFFSIEHYFSFFFYLVIMWLVGVYYDCYHFRRITDKMFILISKDL